MDRGASENSHSTVTNRCGNKMNRIAQRTSPRSGTRFTSSRTRMSAEAASCPLTLIIRGESPVTLAKSTNATGAASAVTTARQPVRRTSLLTVTCRKRPRLMKTGIGLSTESALDEATGSPGRAKAAATVPPIPLRRAGYLAT